MISTVKNTTMERLYLSKGESKEVFINNCELLHQHQIEGLRFMFRQFDKIKSGVIVNYPSGCGKTVLVILFLHAVRNFLNKPVLILCMHNEELSYWKNVFLKWTDYIDEDIAIESSNPYLKKKKVFIKKITDLNSFLRRSWSVVIVKNDTFSKDIAKLVFDADFKIWVTSTDMMKDLPMLSFVYTWINPKAKLSIEDFKPVNNSMMERMKKYILLETFLENVILRRNDMETTITWSKESEKKPLPKISQKNKDASGMKIKRSKIKVNDDATSSVANSTETNIRHNVSCKPCNDMKDEIHMNMSIKSKDHSVTNMEIEDSIPNTTPIETKELNKSTSHDELLEENDSQSLICFDSALEDLIKCENINMTQDMTAKSPNKSKDDNISINEIGLKDNIHISNELNLSEDVLDVETNIKSVIKVDSIKNKTPSKQVLEDSTPELFSNDDIRDDIEVTKLNSPKTERNESHSNFNAVASEDKANISGVQLSDKKHKDIDAKLKELEESTLIQFKGSILDSIF